MIFTCILTVLSILVLLFCLSVKRGQKTVRAFVFLSSVADGESIELSNELAKRIDLHAAGELHAKAMAMVEVAFNGSQLKLISYARLEGFNQ